MFIYIVICLKIFKKSIILGLLWIKDLRNHTNQTNHSSDIFLVSSN